MANKRSEANSRSSETQVFLDDVDREILRVLQIDGRTSNTEIARKLGITETTVRKRIAAMRENEYFEIVAIPTPKVANYNISAIMGFAVVLPNLREIVDALTERPEIRYCGMSTGRFDVIV